MPIIIKDYNWSQTKDQVYINLPLKGVNGHKVDIFSSEEFIKVNFPPYLFEALLYAPIDDIRSTAKIKDGCVTFALMKKEENLWSQLLSERADDKSFLLKKKQEAIEYAQKKSEQLQKEKSEIKEMNKKYSLKETMKLEENDRSRIETIKENERIRTMNELAEWKEQKRMEAEKEKLELLEQFKAAKMQEQEDLNQGCRITEIFDDTSTPELESSQIQEFEKLEEYSHCEIQDRETTKENIKIETKSKPVAVKEKKLPKVRAGPREPGKITVSFTPRVFPTPQRESKAAEENEWLQKQANARKQFEVNEPDLADHEKDPIWLKDKGGQLFASGNYQAAVNAYNLAIKIQPGLPVLYLNRAACQLKLRNLFKCAEDCSTALDIMVPKVQANAKGRLKAHLRRAAAFCELELYVEALQDYEEALKIDPHNTNITEDAAKLRTIIQSGTT